MDRIHFGEQNYVSHVNYRAPETKTKNIQLIEIVNFSFYRPAKASKVQIMKPYRPQISNWYSVKIDWVGEQVYAHFDIFIGFYFIVLNWPYEIFSPWQPNRIKLLQWRQINWLIVFDCNEHSTGYIDVILEWNESIRWMEWAASKHWINILHGINRIRM